MNERNELTQHHIGRDALCLHGVEAAVTRTECNGERRDLGIGCTEVVAKLSHRNTQAIACLVSYVRMQFDQVCHELPKFGSGSKGVSLPVSECFPVCPRKRTFGGFVIEHEPSQARLVPPKLTAKHEGDEPPPGDDIVPL